MDFNGRLMASTALAAAGLVYGARPADAATCGNTVFVQGPNTCTFGSAGGTYRVTITGAGGGTLTDEWGIVALGGAGGQLAFTVDIPSGGGFFADVTVGSRGADASKRDLPRGSPFYSAGSGGYTRLDVNQDGSNSDYSKYNTALFAEVDGGTGGRYRTTFGSAVGFAGNPREILDRKSYFNVRDVVNLSGVNSGDGSVSIELLEDTPAVPIPPAGALLAGGLVSMAAMRKRKAKAAKA